MPSEDSRETECDHRSIYPVAAAAQASRSHVHPPCHLYPQPRELHAADGFSTRISILTPYRLIETTRRGWRTPQASEPALGMNSVRSAARFRGFEEDLGLTWNQFATISSVLYVGYITMHASSYAFYF